MARYRVTRKCYLPIPRSANLSRFYEPGEEIEFDGEPGLALEPLDAEACARKAAAERPFEILPNGVQVRSRQTGAMLNCSVTHMRPKPRLPRT